MSAYWAKASPVACAPVIEIGEGGVGWDGSALSAYYVRGSFEIGEVPRVGLGTRCPLTALRLRLSLVRGSVEIGEGGVGWDGSALSAYYAQASPIARARLF